MVHADTSAIELLVPACDYACGFTFIFADNGLPHHVRPHGGRVVEDVSFNMFVIAEREWARHAPPQPTEAQVQRAERPSDSVPTSPANRVCVSSTTGRVHEGPTVQALPCGPKLR